MRVATLAAVLSLVVCSIGGAASSRPRAQTHTVTIEDMRFQPDALTVARGDSIVWVNKDLVPHTATSTRGAGGFDSKAIESGESWRYTARTKGDFAYTCTFHPTMAAMVHVK